MANRNNRSAEGRVKAVNVKDEEAVDAFKRLSEIEGIIPALESSHAIAYLLGNKSEFKGRTVVVNLSGRGDKDTDIITEIMSY